MLQEYQSENKLVDGKPAGGSASCIGMSINWQNGPLGRGDARLEPNGAFVETVIDAARQRLEFYQEGEFACKENAEALDKLEAALEILNSRTKRREEQQIEGTHEGN